MTEKKSKTPINNQNVITHYIVAIDIGTSHIAGVIGKKHEDETFSIIAYGVENCVSCIRRGNIHNIKDAANHIANLLENLENQTNGNKIDKFYVGIGGQSLRAIDHIESMKIKNGSAITENDLISLSKQCLIEKSDTFNIIDIAQVTYYIDGQKETTPVGISGKMIEGRFKLIIGRDSILDNINKCIQEIVEKDVAGILVSSQALANATLSNREKEIGCVLIDFGAGVTNVSIYSRGELLHTSVIPLGSNLITQDLISLNLTRTEAERLKIKYGSATTNKNDDDVTVDVDMDGLKHTISINELNIIIETRTAEIVENIFARINEVTNFKSLAAGIILAGCGAKLKNFKELIKKKCNIKVRNAEIRNELIRDSHKIAKDPLYMNAISIMFNGTIPCITALIPKSKPENDISPKDEASPNTDDDQTKGGFVSNIKKAIIKIIEETASES
jgi:cell division protein FtsA